MLSQHIALVPEAGGVNASELARVCAALQKQLTRDLAPLWSINATINAFPHLEDVPLGYWPIIITFCELGDQAGVHIDKNGQPYAQVEMAPGWSLHASQACLDMLINPFGRRLVSGPSPRPDQGPVEFLVEIGAPCNDPDSAYVIDEVLVSDFCTPAFWGASSAAQHSFSFTGAIQAAHQVLPGGHLTWHDPITDKWWIRHHLDHSLVDTRLGKLDGRTGVVREAMRLRAPHALRAEKMTVAAFEERLGVKRQHALQASQFQAHRLRSLVASADAELAQELEGGRLLDVRGSDDQRSSQLMSRSGALKGDSKSRTVTMNGPTTARLYGDAGSGGVRHRTSEDDGEVEVTQSDLLDEAQHSPELKRTEVDARAAAAQPPPRTVPPPLPEEPQRGDAYAAQRPDPNAPVPILQTPIPKAPIPRAAPLPPPRVPERSYASGSTAPPVAIGQSPLSPSRPSPSGWLLGASVLAGAATVVVAIVLYGRVVQSDASVAPAAAPLAIPVPAPSPVSPPVALPTPVVAAATAAPSATTVAAPPPVAAPPAVAAPPVKFCHARKSQHPRRRHLPRQQHGPLPHRSLRPMIPTRWKA